LTQGSSPQQPYILWGTPHSLFTGKARACLIKRGIPFRERCPSDPRYKQKVMPEVGLVTFPVLETPDGKFIQDSTDIVDYLETEHQERSMIPPTPVQHIVARLLDGFGLQGLLAAAMHYRWTYRDEQEHFLRTEFGRGLYNGPDRQIRQEAGARTMSYFSGALPTLGVTPETISAIEAAYEDLLDALDAHFQIHPYLLGALPSIADLGFIAPMFAHLGRDPVPASLMKKRAPNVFRWVERMNLPTLCDGEYPEAEGVWFADDALPLSLEPVLALVFRDWGPQLQADAAAYEAWLDSTPARTAGELISADGERRVHASLGMVEYSWRGCNVRRNSAVQGLWLFDKVVQAANALEAGPRARFDTLLKDSSGESVMALRLKRGIKRQNNVLVLE
jgi:glutathione S-transferase